MSQVWGLFDLGNREPSESVEVWVHGVHDKVRDLMLCQYFMMLSKVTVMPTSCLIQPFTTYSIFTLSKATMRSWNTMNYVEIQVSEKCM